MSVNGGIPLLSLFFKPAHLLDLSQMLLHHITLYGPSLLEYQNYGILEIESALEGQSKERFNS